MCNNDKQFTKKCDARAKLLVLLSVFDAVPILKVVGFFAVLDAVAVSV